MQNIPIIDVDFIEAHTDYSELITKIEKAFKSSKTKVPLRHHHDFSNHQEKTESTLLIMPAWNPGKNLGVKIVTVNPANDKYNLPSIQGVYIYFDARKGIPVAILEAKALTVKRTAATSALASSFLSKKNASSMLMIGTGSLSSELILAHAKVRPIQNVFVWGRNYKKAQAICNKLKNENFKVSPVKSLERIIGKVDIISCATLSKTPLVHGKFLKKGQHIDLVGAFKKDMREADDDTIKKTNIFLDTYEGGLKESGDIVIPLKSGILNKNDIKADLFELCQQKKKGRCNDNEITVFKSVGHALEDLTAAKYYYEKHQIIF